MTRDENIKDCNYGPSSGCRIKINSMESASMQSPYPDI